MTEHDIIRELLDVIHGYREYVDALPEDMVACLPAMPGMNGDWVNEVIDQAVKTIS